MEEESMKDLSKKTLKTFGILLLLTVSLALFSGNASAAVITVCSSGCDYTTINGAIDNSSDYDIVQVSAGTYTENIDFDGKDITVMSVAGPDDTTIDGNDSGSVVTFDSGEICATLSGFTITNGSGTLESSYYRGCGIYIKNCSPTIINCNITDNSTSNSYVKGGGIYLYNSSAIIANCTISETALSGSPSFGGGIYCQNGAPNISKTTIINNSLTGNGSYGGGFYIYNSSPIITDCTIGAASNPNTAKAGGGFWIFGSGNSTLINSTISYNTAPTSNGGGFYISSSGTTTMTNCTIDHNEAYNGGGIAAAAGTLTMTDCTVEYNEADPGYGGGVWSRSSGSISGGNISNNTAVWRGGGFYSDGTSNLTVSDCVIDNNTTLGNGGGIYIHYKTTSASMEFLDCDIRENTAAGGGGGVWIYNYGAGTYDPVFERCQIRKNSNNGIYTNSDPDFNNCTIVDNESTGDGGGIVVTASPSFDSCTISNNAADDEGGGIYVSGASGAPTVDNSILYGNSAETSGGGDEVYIGHADGSIAINYSDIDTSKIEGPGSSSGSNNVNADPQFNDDTNGTILLRDYHLTDSSTSVIDAGSTTLSDDIDEDSRPQNSDDDMGSDERYVAP
jgi:hypothetical protein